MTTQVVILAAGQGKRMFSNLPKVLHHLAGKPMLEHVIQTAKAITNTQPIVIYGHQGEVVQQALAHHDVKWVEQKEQLGTGHALLQALPFIAEQAKVLVLYGDVPFVQQTTLQQLVEKTSANSMAILTTELTQPYGYGRIMRDHNQQVTHIVEEKDATEEQRQVKEINSGIYCIPSQYLKTWLPQLKNQNAQKEYYLTDVITLASQDHIPIHAVHPKSHAEIMGINDKLQLAELERLYQKQYAEQLMRQGVTLLDPARFDVRGNVKAGKDVVIDVNVILEGDIELGDHCRIGANVILKNVKLGSGTEIKSHSVIEDAIIGSHCLIGPFARLRPGAQLANDVHIGNFVEVKNSTLDEKTKVNHLSYIGDSQVGKRVNVGAGTITCNYDGANKHKTIIEDDVHIGSDTQLVAPITVGAGATIGAGATVTEDVPGHALTVTHRLEQRSYADWKRPVKK